MIAGDQPLLRRNSAIHRTSGVLPVPPTVRLPTTITGMPGCALLSKRSAYSARRTPTAMPKTRLTGHSSQAMAPRRYQNFTLLRGLRREGDLRKAGDACRFHHADHRLVRRGCVRGDHDHRLFETRASATQLLRE